MVERVLTTGCFDVMHWSHVVYLQAIRRRWPSCRLYVGVGDDGTVRRLKGDGRPIVPERLRALQVRALSCVDEAFVFDAFEDGGAEEKGMGRLIEFIDPCVFATGPRSPNRTAERYLGRCEFVVLEEEEVPPFTTTMLVEKIATYHSERGDA